MSDNDTIAALFQKDPFTLTKEDIDRIIEYYRERRKEFVLYGKSAPKLDKKVDLEDLGLI